MLPFKAILQVSLYSEPLHVVLRSTSTSSVVPFHRIVTRITYEETVPIGTSGNDSFQVSVRNNKTIVIGYEETLLTRELIWSGDLMM